MKRRILERVAGRGKLYLDERFIHDVTYQLVHYEDVIELHTSDGTEQIGGNRGIEGSISGGDFFNLLQEHLTLHLSDGRRINFMLRHTSGELVGDGDFYN